MRNLVCASASSSDRSSRRAQLSLSFSDVCRRKYMRTGTSSCVCVCGGLYYSKYRRYRRMNERMDDEW